MLALAAFAGASAPRAAIAEDQVICGCSTGAFVSGDGSSAATSQDTIENNCGGKDQFDCSNSSCLTSTKKDYTDEKKKKLAQDLNDKAAKEYAAAQATSKNPKDEKIKKDWDDARNDLNKFKAEKELFVRPCVTAVYRSAALLPAGSSSSDLSGHEPVAHEPEYEALAEMFDGASPSAARAINNRF